MQLKTPKLLFIGAGVVFALGLGGNYLLYGGLSDAQTELKKMRTQIKDESKIKRQLTEISERLAVSQSKLNHLEQSVTATDYVPTLLTELERLGVTKGLKITGVRPKVSDKSKPKPKEDPNAPADDKKAKKKPVPKPYEELIIEVKGTGYYGAINEFVKALNNFPKIVGVYTLDIAPQSQNTEEKPGSKVLEMTMEIKAYVFPTDERAGTAMGPQPMFGESIHG